MEITSTTTEKAIIVYVDGDLTTASSPEAQKEIDEILGEGEGVNVIINVERVNFIASTGLRIILALGKRLNSSGAQLVVCSMNQTTKAVFKMSGFNKLFNTFDTEKEAIESL
jgi:anti-anti-sigma factor